MEEEECVCPSVHHLVEPPSTSQLTNQRFINCAFLERTPCSPVLIPSPVQRARIGVDRRFSNYLNYPNNANHPNHTNHLNHPNHSNHLNYIITPTIPTTPTISTTSTLPYVLGSTVDQTVCTVLVQLGTGEAPKLDL